MACLLARRGACDDSDSHEGGCLSGASKALRRVVRMGDLRLGPDLGIRTAGRCGQRGGMAVNWQLYRCSRCGAAECERALLGREVER